MHSRQTFRVALFAALVALLSNRPALGQVVQPLLSLNNNIGNALVSDPMSFGRGQVTFHFFVSASNADSLDTNLLATLPPGVSFVSTTNGSLTSTTASAAGEQVTISLGTLAAGQTLFAYAFTVAIDHTPPDGARLQASFQISGHADGSSILQFSNVITFQFQAGYLPLSVSYTGYNALCSGSAGSTATGFVRINRQSNDGTPIAFTALDDSGASAFASTSGLSVPPPSTAGTFAPVKLGEIASPTNLLQVSGLGYQVNAQGGGVYVADVSANTIAITPTSGSSSCSQVAELGFTNPNDYAVPIILDRRLSAYSAAGNEAAQDPISGVHFGFPGDAEFGGGDFVRSGGGVATNTYFQRTLYAPGGNTQRVKKEITCFPEAQDTCDSSPFSDTTQSVRAFNNGLFSSKGGLLIPGGASLASLELSLVGNEDIDASGGTNFSLDANTGSVSVVRSGYGAISAEMTNILMRGDASVNSIETGLPARLQVTGLSPINLQVSDGQGRRVGFRAADVTAVQVPAGIPAPRIDAQPIVLTEIRGASYSGIDSHPQVIAIPDPNAGPYQVQVTGTGNGPFTITIETFDINDQSIDLLSQSGTASPGSSNAFTVSLAANGHLSIPGAPGADTSPPETTATLFPQPNAAGWNNGPVSLMLDAIDNDGGSGVKQITYSATGGQAIGSTTVDAASANVDVAADGQTTISFFATDNAGNPETAKQTVVRIDRTAPTISCGGPDGQWHAADVSIPCAASDGLSGLANPSAASLSLSTAVPEGTETDSAATGSAAICDVAGNCANAGPIGGNRVDKKPPSISITAPAHAVYLLNQAVAASYTCTDGGSGVSTCAGSVNSGARLDTASVGNETFSVSATDKVGNAAVPQSVNYTVAYNVCVLYDVSRAARSGSTIPMKMQLCDANGNDVSSSSVVVRATSLLQSSTLAAEIIQDSGNANPDGDFRYDSSLGPTGGYILNLSTRGLGTGTYALSFAAGADPTTHTLTFQVR